MKFDNCNHEIPEWMEDIISFVEKHIPEDTKDNYGNDLRARTKNIIYNLIASYKTTGCNHEDMPNQSP